MAQHTDLSEHSTAVAAGAAHGAPDIAGDAAHSAEAAGLPQLDFSTFPNQIVWLLVALFAIYFILKRVALPRIGSVLAERQGTITNDLAGAEDLKKKAEDAEAAYDRALAEARGEAGRIVEAAKAEMQVDLDAATSEADERINARLAESEARIGEVRDGAVEAIREVARDAAAEIVRTLGGEADDAAIARAVQARMGETA